MSSVLSSHGHKKGGGGVKSRLSSAQRLRAMLSRQSLSFLMEAHSGLSAKIVEEAGCEGIWASGLAMSASMGVRDSNEASWTQILECLEFMADACSLPILLDGDTGYGNFNNARRLVKKLCQRGIAGVCLEDKLFPKTNSFIGARHPLADVEEFCGKLQAIQETKPSQDFVLVARVEALIAGLGMAEALRRAECYRLAGADAILIHSKRRDAQEVLEFSREWASRCPLVIVPTKYIHTEPTRYQEAGISMVIWANHMLRASIHAMQSACAVVRKTGSPAMLEDTIAPMDEVFRLSGNDELRQAEQRYLRHSASHCHRAIILAASRGQKLDSLTTKMPKAMLDVRGKPLLKRLVDVFKKASVSDITVVRGYGKAHVVVDGVTMVDNPRHADYGEAWSLFCAKEPLQEKRDDLFICYGDILCKPALIDAMAESHGALVMAVCPVGWQEQSRHYRRADDKRDWVCVSRPYDGDYFSSDKETYLTAFCEDNVCDKTKVPSSQGEWLGVVRVRGEGHALLWQELCAMEKDGTIRTSAGDMPMLFRRLLKRGVRVHVLYNTFPWLDIDDIYDLAEARNQNP
ncbi:MAG: phosphoenolpyruvate mutase [Alphaproteobacteria bacterium GM7ARS4]|nr:phosphoenolpyruvate mutase [Alphaproteobacteria bacterium GM7ARS4]